jgi:short-subunit dehydrogenase
MLEPLKGKHIWIIGASSGIGRALAIEMAHQGAILSLSARNLEALQDLQKTIGAGHSLYPLDVTDHTKLKNAANAQPRIDSVIFMAGVYEPCSVFESDINATQNIININLMGAFNTIHAVLPIMRAQKSGQIALCGSVAGYRGLPNGQPYSATKAAIINLAETLRLEEKQNGIDVRLISPGFVNTPLTQKNKFAMPMMIEPEQAAKAIIQGLLGQSFDIHFPKKFTCIMKMLHLLPDWLYFKIASKI